MMNSRPWGDEVIDLIPPKKTSRKKRIKKRSDDGSLKSEDFADALTGSMRFVKKER